MSDTDLMEAVDRVMNQYTAVHDELKGIWKEQMLFTWHWWVDLSLAVLPWILWIIIHDRRQAHRLLYGGMFSAFVATILDMVGVSRGGWSYNTSLLPSFPEFLPWDWTVMPVTAMLFYQFFPRINPWLKGAVFGAFAAYVVEPVFIWVGFYEPALWEHHYSLPIYFAIYMAGYWLYTRRFHSLESYR